MAKSRPPTSRPENREAGSLESALSSLERQNEYLAALHETSLILMDRLDKKELLSAILERAASLAGTEHGYIYLLEPGEAEMQMRVGKGIFESLLGLRIKRGEGAGGYVWETEGPLVVENYRIWPGRLPHPALDSLHSVVGIPLKSESQVLGVIGLGRISAGNRFGREDLTVLGRFADLALLALDKARLYSEARRELAERKRTEEILRESEERYRSLLESSPDPIVVYDMTGVATYVNPAFEQTFGLSRDELLGKQIDFVPEEAWPETRAAIEAMLRGNKIQLFETRRLTRDGRVLDVQLSSTLYMDRSGKAAGNIVTLRDISARKRAEEELRRTHDHLEELVHARTAELANANVKLEQEIEERKRVEKALRRREAELKAQSHHLEEVNTALKVLIKQREDNKKEIGETILSNIGALVDPYLEKLKKSRLNTGQQALVNIIGANLENITSPFASRLSSKFLNLTPMEVRVANLVKAGKTNKEIAELLLLSKNTVLFHRYNIRTKLGLKGKKINLRTRLLSFEE
jgi:PAS domain S-box-containing protein